MNEVNIRKMNLQLFAGEGSGGAGAGAGTGSGEGAAAASGSPGPQERRSGANPLADVVYGIQTQEHVQPGEGAAQPDDAAQAAQQEQPPRQSFRDLIRSDEYKAEADEYIQGVIQSRLKGAKANETLLGKAQEVLQRVAMRYDMDASDLSALDFKQLSDRIDGDTLYYEQRAAENGITVEMQKQLDEARMIKSMQARRSAAAQQETEVRSAFDDIARQANEMRAKGIEIDINAEMQNPQFRQMVMPPQLRGAGLSVEQAHAALHYREMMGAGMQAAARQARENLTNSIRAGQQRPPENGATSTRAVDVRADPAKLSKADRAEIRRRAERGEKISF